MEEAMRRRDAALRELAHRFYPANSVSARAREIHKLAIRYASSAWLRERNMETLPPGSEGTRRQWLWLAFKSGALMPVSERQLRHLLGP
jgi:hypothetical protein